MKIRSKLALLGILLWSLAACGGQAASSPATPIPDPEPGKATMTGSIFSISANRPLQTSIWLAEVRRQGDQAIYFLDSVNSPAILSDAKGIFVFSNVAPGEYVLIVGDPEGQNEAIQDTSGNIRVWNLPAGQVFDAGEIRVRLTP